MKKLFVFLIAVLTLALMGCGGDAPKKDAAAPPAATASAEPVQLGRQFRSGGHCRI
ncbi:MAG: hypothetical protein ACLRXQ_11245 [Phascolarctobacterium faecium]